MELPPQFHEFLHLINYYRDVLHIDCLTSTSEKFRLYAGYHIYNTKNRQYVCDDGDYLRDWYSCDRLVICHKRVRKEFNQNDSMYKELSEVSSNEIKSYLYDMYPHFILKMIKNQDDIITFKSQNNEMINLHYQQFKLYCGFYHNVIKPYKNEFKVNKCIIIPISFSSNTVKCIEKLINLEDYTAYKHVENLYEYIMVYDYLVISVKS